VVGTVVRAVEKFPLARRFLLPLGDRFAAGWVLDRLIQRTGDAHDVTWLGRQIWQYPLDAWILQEIVSQLRPQVIIETGTYHGGSAFFFATICDALGLEGAEVVSIDIAAEETIPHPRITYISGSSVDPHIIDEVRARAAGRNVFIVLDSDHTAPHVQAELELYAPLVPLGGYVHVQDGILDTMWRFRKGSPGPVVAVKAFLKSHADFVRDESVETRYVMTAHPYGWLRRVSSYTS
jgi:cephalosporin hydroxylase